MKIRDILPLLATAMMLAACTDDNEKGPQGPVDDPIEEDSYHNYAVAAISIETEGHAAVESKENYVNCTVTLDGKGAYADYEGTARIRGRGNSTWLWYPKKPYRIKLDKKSEWLGIEADKDWVLLANYRDPTHLMNTVAFEMGTYMRLPHTNHTRFAEVTLNGDYIGLYMVTEQVEEGDYRINVDATTGRVIQLDADDGPELSPEATDNFWSTTYEMPVCVKFPDDEDLTPAVLAGIRNELGELEQAIRKQDFEAVSKLLDVRSMIDFLLVQEIVDNVELCAPRSMYMHRNDAQSPWVMGPLWDFDAGFDFDWSTMYDGHNYFADYKDLILGSDPYEGKGCYGYVPRFFLDLFGMKEFVAAYKARWNELKGPMIEEVQNQLAAYRESLLEPMKRNDDRWPIQPTYRTEIRRMSTWIDNRVAYLDGIINAYPEGR